MESLRALVLSRQPSLAIWLLFLLLPVPLTAADSIAKHRIFRDLVERAGFRIRRT